ncbi:hypothetical protein BDZ94DRAFT_1315629 [Collybia nuda]|uniref:Uncharacterized protein n=1 Tax=Collybia nuda TaxID=64659 RepID=A0A9P5XSC5_9AGAR|nr:hypothetical protein BDZ94DRAFT_1315629 [Collybia nuda]
MGQSQAISIQSWLNDLLGRENSDNTFLMMSYFQTLLIDIHQCSGHPDIGGLHVEITDSPCRKAILTLNSIAHNEYGGDFGKYVTDFFSGNRTYMPSQSCWRVKEGISLCPGTRQDIKGLPISIPISLCAEIKSDSGVQDVWDFPLILFPETDLAAKRHDIVYDLVGFALFSPTLAHFIAQYVHHNNIITYDGMKHNGVTILEENATTETHLTGRHPILPAGYTIHQAFYRL